MTIAFQTAFFDLQILNVLHRSMVCAASVRNYLQLFRWDFIFSQTFPLVKLLSPLPFEFSRVAYLFEMSPCDCCVSRRLTSWDRLSLHHTFVFLAYLLAFFPPESATTTNCSVSRSASPTDSRDVQYSDAIAGQSRHDPSDSDSAHKERYNCISECFHVRTSCCWQIFGCGAVY